MRPSAARRATGAERARRRTWTSTSNCPRSPGSTATTSPRRWRTTYAISSRTWCAGTCRGRWADGPPSPPTGPWSSRATTPSRRPGDPAARRTCTSPRPPCWRARSGSPCASGGSRTRRPPASSDAGPRTGGTPGTCGTPGTPPVCERGAEPATGRPSSTPTAAPAARTNCPRPIRAPATRQPAPSGRPCCTTGASSRRPSPQPASRPIRRTRAAPAGTGPIRNGCSADSRSTTPVWRRRSAGWRTRASASASSSRATGAPASSWSPRLPVPPPGCG